MLSWMVYTRFVFQVAVFLFKMVFGKWEFRGKLLDEQKAESPVERFTCKHYW